MRGSDLPNRKGGSSISAFHPLLKLRLSAVSRLLALAVGLTGVLVLVGWASDITGLKSVLPGLATMKPNTAAAFLLASLSVVLQDHRFSGRLSCGVARASAVAVGLVAGLTLFEYLVGWSTGIDEILFHDSGSGPHSVYPGRMSPATALSFVVASLALLLQMSVMPRCLVAAQVLALMIGLTSLLPLLGYLYGVPEMYGVFLYASVALHTAAALVLLGIAILLMRPDVGPMRIVMARSAGGQVARRLVPAGVLTPLILGWLRWKGEEAGFYGTSFGLALMVFSCTVVLVVLVWTTAALLHGSDIRRQGATASLATATERLRILHEIDRAIIAAKAPAAIAEGALRALRELLGVPRVIVNLFDLEAGEAEWLAAVGRRRSYLEPGFRYPLSLLGDVAALRRGEAQVIDVVAQPSSRHVDALLESGVRWFMVVPMIADGELLGGLSFGGEPAEFPPEHVVIAKEVAIQLAIAIAQARLRERVTVAEQQYRGIFENAVEGIFRTTRDGRFLLVNPAMARIYGYASPGEMTTLVTNIPEQTYANPEDRHELLRLLDRQPVVSRFESRARRKDGSEIWVSQSLRAIRDETGGLLHYEGNLEEITERKRAEEGLRQSEKLAALSSLVAGVAHELNNPLAVILGHSTLLIQSHAPGLEERGKKILNAAERCARLVKNFLALARQHPPERQQVSLNEVVRETVELVAYGLRVDGVVLALNLASELPPLWADPHQLQQVVLNLLTNAHHALRAKPSERHITVRTWSGPGGRTIGFSVADSGHGIPSAVRNRLFEPFFTTKPVGQGTGLGLSLCRGIVESHGGVIAVDNVPKGGALFTVELPVVEAPAVSTTAAAEDRPIPGLRILVVDDEEEVAGILAEILATDGHRTDVAANGAIALRRLGGEGSPDVIFSDVRMPELDGPGLYQALKATNHPLCDRFVFITGDVISAETREFLERTKRPALAKPFMAAEVRHVLRRVLG